MVTVLATARADLARRALAEYLGTVFLTLGVVGSGIAAVRLSPANTGEALAINAGVTATVLVVVILVFAPISGAHLNPAISLVDAAVGRLPWRRVPVYIAAQVLGCVSGAVLANLLFGLPAVVFSRTDRATLPHLAAETVATAGLVLVVFLLARAGDHRIVAVAVAAYIGGVYFFASSTGFANPAITVGRMFSDTFAGIAPSSAPAFVLAQLLGAAVGLALVVALIGRRTFSDAAVLFGTAVLSDTNSSRVELSE